VPIKGTEVAERADLIRDAVLAAGGEIRDPFAYDDKSFLAVHKEDFLDFMRSAWKRWEQSSYPIEPGQNRVVPYVFPIRQLIDPKRPASIGALTGLYAMDTMTLIGPGTWEAARTAGECAMTCADLVVDGARAAYAAVRPPGHHVGAGYYGGSCYLNNAALAAQRLRDQGVSSVAVIDLDAHHGNGTQEIFYRRADVRYGSTHVDPGRGWFPHYLGFADEIGEGAGEGFNLNLPLAPGTRDDGWLVGVDRLVEFSSNADMLVVSLGVDAAAEDPESPLQVTEAAFREAGTRIGRLGRPTVIVQEGGYHLPTLGALTVAFLGGFESAGTA
jgi:acetoin utilization deacetylase AcuC-like enzyme